MRSLFLWRRAWRRHPEQQESTHRCTYRFQPQAPEPCSQHLRAQPGSVVSTKHPRDTIPPFPAMLFTHPPTRVPPCAFALRHRDTLVPFSGILFTHTPLRVPAELIPHPLLRVPPGRVISTLRLWDALVIAPAMRFHHPLRCKVHPWDAIAAVPAILIQHPPPRVPPGGGVSTPLTRDHSGKGGSPFWLNASAPVAKHHTSRTHAHCDSCVPTGWCLPCNVIPGSLASGPRTCPVRPDCLGCRGPQLC